VKGKLWIWEDWRFGGRIEFPRVRRGIDVTVERQADIDDDAVVF
jgi:hypothetical protein